MNKLNYYLRHAVLPTIMASLAALTINLMFVIADNIAEDMTRQTEFEDAIKKFDSAQIKFDNAYNKYQDDKIKYMEHCK